MGNVSKRRAVDVSVHRATAEELGMVEGVEHLETNLQGLRFGELCDLVKRYVVVVHAWPIEWPARRVTRRAQRIGAEERCVEVWLPVPRVMVDLKVAGNFIRQVDTDSVDPVVLDVDQGVVPEAGKRDRQARRKASDT